MTAALVTMEEKYISELKRNIFPMKTQIACRYEYELSKNVPNFNGKNDVLQFSKNDDICVGYQKTFNDSNVRINGAIKCQCCASLVEAYKWCTIKEFATDVSNVRDLILSS